jgi:hypothetical protein
LPDKPARKMLPCIRIKFWYFTNFSKKKQNQKIFKVRLENISWIKGENVDRKCVKNVKKDIRNTEALIYRYTYIRNTGKILNKNKNSTTKNLYFACNSALFLFLQKKGVHLNGCMSLPVFGCYRFLIIKEK